eukprot:TRINITY_DN3850_c0_g1_i18.p1 TRINITY_DN3850_c0_g1~~TRINITY_DN3850_c0_g1_i18.p1  ORF type:complete len:481 (-),score=33.63 TRINITY_DN3850_c0_g1_i18:194-1636(-)
MQFSLLLLVFIQDVQSFIGTEFDWDNPFSSSQSPAFSFPTFSFPILSPLLPPLDWPIFPPQQVEEEEKEEDDIPFTVPSPPNPITNPVNNTIKPPIGAIDVSSSINNFGASMINIVCDNTKNCVFSPFNIMSALGLLLAGAQSNTRQQMLEAMFLVGQSTDEINAGYKSVIDTLTSQSDAYKLLSANRMYAQSDFEFLATYLSQIQQFYNSEIVQADFGSNPEVERININNWVSQVTQNLINDLIPEGLIDKNTITVLVSALYFKGFWLSPFDKKQTDLRDFTLLNGNKVQVATMVAREIDVNVGGLFDNQASYIELPYEGQDVSMFIVLPRPYRNDQLVRTLTIDDISRRIDAQMIQQMVKGSQFSLGRYTVFLPKFEIDQKIQLKSVLNQLGIIDAFNTGADFRGMVEGESISVDSVIHQAKIIVDEEGTEAAASTIIGVGITSVPEIFSVDEPFIYMIVHKPTQAVLFIGEIIDPSI